MSSCRAGEVRRHTPNHRRQYPSNSIVLPIADASLPSSRFQKPKLTRHAVDAETIVGF